MRRSGCDATNVGVCDVVSSDDSTIHRSRPIAIDFGGVSPTNARTSSHSRNDPDVHVVPGHIA